MLHERSWYDWDNVILNYRVRVLMTYYKSIQGLFFKRSVHLKSTLYNFTTFSVLDGQIWNWKVAKSIEIIDSLKKDPVWKLHLYILCGRSADIQKSIVILIKTNNKFFPNKIKFKPHLRPFVGRRVTTRSINRPG